MLEKLDGLKLASTFMGNKVKKFSSHQQLQLALAPDLEDKVIPILDKFFADTSTSNLSDALNNISNFLILTFPQCARAVLF